MAMCVQGLHSGSCRTSLPEPFLVRTVVPEVCSCGTAVFEPREREFEREPRFFRYDGIKESRAADFAMQASPERPLDTCLNRKPGVGVVVLG